VKKPFTKSIQKELGAGFVLITCGLPATGKTWATETIGGITGYPILRSDLIRRELFQDEDVFDEKVASDTDKRRLVYDAMFREAEAVLKKSKSILLDATFYTQELRRRAAGIAAGHKLRLIILETVCPQEVAIKRILARTREDYRSNALTEQAYLNNKTQFEPVDLGDIREHYPELDITYWRVDTAAGSPEDWYIV